MNGILLGLLVIALVGMIGLAFGVLEIHREYEVIQTEIDDLRLSIIGVGGQSTDAAQKAVAAHSIMKDLMNDMNELKSGTQHSLNEIRKSVYGPADISEFKRVETAAYAADLRSKGLEKIIQSMDGRNVTPRHRKSIQNGLMTVSIADDEHAINPEVRDSDA